MKLLTGGHTLPHLEEHHCIRTVRCRLIADQPHLSRSFQGRTRKPVRYARRLLHQTERDIPLHAPHQIMLKCNVCRPFCCLRIVVPGNEIHVFSPLLIIQTVIKAHQIGRNLRIRNPFLNRRILRPEILQHAVRHEPLVIQRNAGEHASSFFKMFAQKIRRHNLFPFIEGMSPEMRVPRLIHGIQ